MIIKKIEGEKGRKKKKEEDKRRKREIKDLCLVARTKTVVLYLPLSPFIFFYLLEIELLLVEQYLHHLYGSLGNRCAGT
ncbi:MAG: hypothetical protein K2G86_07505, partial [Prevotella sp.]|nr:hypothetical protein [Prevotella sp.]